VTRPLPAESRQHRAERVHDAEDVRLEDRTDGGVACLLHCGDQSVAGIVHDDVDATKPSQRRLYCCRKLRFVRDVSCRDEERVGLIEVSMCAFVVAHGCRHAVTARQRLVCDGGAKAARSAGHEPDTRA
jgi:hypothetical protein